jgi:hypothetical protein
MSLGLFIVAAAIAAGHAAEAREVDLFTAEIEPERNFVPPPDDDSDGRGGCGGGGYDNWFESAKYQSQTAEDKLHQLMDMCPGKQIAPL